MTALPAQILQWGIFEIAYEPRRRFSIPNKSTYTLLLTFCELSFIIVRFLQDLLRIAPSTFFTYAILSAWLGASPAISLHISHSILQQVEALAAKRDASAPFEHAKVMASMSMWLFLVFISVLMRRLKDDKELLLCGYLRAHFLPSYVEASLNADVKFIYDHNARRYFPNATSFGEGGPGWDLLKSLSERSQTLIALVSELTVIYWALSQRTVWDRWLLGGLLALFLGVLVLSPSNGVNGAGYAFWTKSNAFNRLHRLYSIIFSTKFRETLAKDGLNEFLCQEYNKCSSDLGVVKSDVITLACVLPPPWYWAVLRSLFLDYPMVLCALPLFWSPSPLIITTLLFFQNATSVLGRSLEYLKRGFNQDSLLQLLVQARALYKPLSKAKETRRDIVQYTPQTPRTGMGLHLRNVTFQYQDSAKEAATLKNVSLFIPANSFVLLVGANGSGKSTLLKLISRLLEPNSGEILVDYNPLARYEPLSIRKHITFLMQSEEVYPMSFEDNLLMAIPGHMLGKKQLQEKMDEAIRLGGARQLIDRVGYGAILNPPSMLAQSLQGCGNGVIGEAAIRELERNAVQRSTSISNGEKQRFLAARAFMRLLNTDSRLLMVDEPTSALDLVAEHNLFEEFYRRRDGKTTIFVTHRFGSLAKQADMIVCMKNGEIVQKGRHDELMALGGEYARLYEAQQGISIS